MSQPNSTASSSPFTQIVAAEEQQEARVHAEMQKLRQEQEDAAQTYEKRERETEAKEREAARETLRAFMETEPRKMVEEAEKEARNLATRFEEKAQAGVPALAKSLAQQLVSPGFLIR